MSVVLSNRHITVVVDPEAGGSISHLGMSGDSHSNVLASYHWLAPQPASKGLSYGDSRLDWLSGYRGGWQLLTPNAGAECEHLGMTHPFHGEVSTARWDVKRSTPTSLVMETGTRGPLAVRRTIVLDRETPAVLVETALINETALPAAALLVEHIAFKSDDATLVELPRGHWEDDEASLEQAGPHDTRSMLSSLRQPCTPGGFRLGYVTEVESGCARVTNSRSGLGAEVTWEAQDFPSLWYWQERGSEGFPWFGRADITALEPATAWPADGLAAAAHRGRAVIVQPFEEHMSSVRVELLRDPAVPTNEQEVAK